MFTYLLNRLRRNFFSTRGEGGGGGGECVSCLRACFGARLLLQSYYPNISEGADRVGGQLRGDKECPFSGVTKSGRVWRKVPESDARSPFSGVTKSGSLEEGAGKRCSECIAFRHLPPNTARFSYATEGALFISAQLSPAGRPRLTRSARPSESFKTGTNMTVSVTVSV